MYSSYYTTPAVSSSASSADVEGILAVIMGLGVLFWIIAIALCVLILIAKWKLFKKAGVDAWESLIPVHNEIVELQLGGVKTYWWFLCLIPYVGPFIVLFWKSIALAKAFGKGAGFGVLLALFPFVCYPILGFGKAEYVGPETK